MPGSTSQWLRKFGKFTVPDFIGERYYSKTARKIAVLCLIFISFTYIAGQMRGVGIVFSRFLEVDITTGVIVGMAIVFFYAVLGGMKGITYTQVAQYCVLIFAYLVRFLTVATGSITNGLSRVRPSVDHSGRLLGLSQFGVISKLHIPIIRGSVFTAVLVCFVDILKELPATLILRPFDFNTLAVKAYELAGDERLVDASVPSILIVLVGLVPVVWLNRSVNQE